jgi:hypothetical protein
MGDKSPKSIRRDRKQKDVTKARSKQQKDARQQGSSQLPTRDKR